MFTPPLLARAVELHQRDLRAELARDRQADKAMAGTRTRGGFFHLAAARAPRRERAHLPSAGTRPPALA